MSGLKSCLLTKATAGNDFSKIDILVATPMRLKILLQHEKIDLSKVLHLVLDEADKLFEMGFVEQIDAVVAACNHRDVTRALFSGRFRKRSKNWRAASWRARCDSPSASATARRVRLRSECCFVDTRPVSSSRCAELFVKALNRRHHIHAVQGSRQHLAKELTGDGLHIGLIHAEMSDSKREEQVDRFRAGETWVLIATDLMARGMDFVGVSTVINFDFPGSPTSYIHRIGRSGRAGRPGSAITFFTEEDAQRGDLRPIANVMKNSGCGVPEWMLNHTGEKGTRRRKRKDGREDNPRRAPLDAPMGADPKAYARAKKKRTMKRYAKKDGEAMRRFQRSGKQKESRAQSNVCVSR